jgi:hypothetical protein
MVTDDLPPETDFFVANTDRMRYPQFREQHLFIGSGVIEAGCKTAIAQRLKRSGMFGTVRGAKSILALRCCHLNGRFEDYREGRRALLCRAPDRSLWVDTHRTFGYNSCCVFET